MALPILNGIAFVEILREWHRLQCQQKQPIWEVKRVTERLTIKRNNGDCVLKAESCCYGWYSFDVQESLRKEGTEILKKAIYKLAEYETAEEEGRLLVLPCKVGDKVYIIDDIDYSYERDSVVTGIDIDKDGISIMIQDESPMSSSGYDIQDFGKTIFLNRDSAEKALEEMKRI